MWSSATAAFFYIYSEDEQCCFWRDSNVLCKWWVCECVVAESKCERAYIFLLLVVPCHVHSNSQVIIIPPAIAKMSPPCGFDKKQQQQQQSNEINASHAHFGLYRIMCNTKCKWKRKFHFETFQGLIITVFRPKWNKMLVFIFTFPLNFAPADATRAHIFFCKMCSLHHTTAPVFWCYVDLWRRISLSLRLSLEVCCVFLFLNWMEGVVNSFERAFKGIWFIDAHLVNITMMATDAFNTLPNP